MLYSSFAHENLFCIAAKKCNWLNIECISLSYLTSVMFIFFLAMEGD